MFPSLPLEVQQELLVLAQRHGQPVVQTVDLSVNSLFDPLTKTDRYGEVCMVVRRPNGRLITATKTIYPKGAYRLLTGGINFGEPVFDALLRETNEETGLAVKVQRFLAAVAYRIAGRDETPVFYTFAFLLDELAGRLGITDETEKIKDFLEVAPDDLPKMANYLSQMPATYSDNIDGNWHDWGQFRAVIHHLVWDALKSHELHP